MSFLRTKKTKELLRITDYVTVEEAGEYDGQCVKVRGCVTSDNPVTAGITKQKAVLCERTKIGVWRFSSSFMEERVRQSQPFFLESKNAQKRLYLTDTQDQPQDLEEVHVCHEAAGNFLLSLLLGQFQIKYPYKYIVSEKIVRLEQPIIGLGQIRKHEEGLVRLIPPKNSLFSLYKNPYLVTTKTEEELLAMMENKEWKEKVTSIFFAFLAAACITGSLKTA